MKLRFSLKQIWTSIILFAVIVPVAAVMIWYGRTTYHNQLNNALLIELQANEALRDQIELEVKRLKTLLKNKSDPLAFLVGRTNNPRAKKEMSLLLGLIVEREPAVNGVIVLTKQAEVIAVVEPGIGLTSDKTLSATTLQATGLHWGYDTAYEHPEVVIPSFGRTYISSPRRHEDGIAFNIAVPIGKPAKAVLIAEFDVEKLWLADAYNRHGIEEENMRDYILDRRGSLVTAVKGSDYQAGDIMTHLPIVRTALIDGEWPTKTSYIGVTNEPVFGTMITVSSLNWTLISEIIVSRVTQPIKEELLEIILLTMLGLIIFIGLILRLVNKTIKPVEATCKAIEQVASGHYQIDLKPSGIAELDKLTDDFNNMARARQDAENSLREREQNLAITLDSIGDAVIATDATGHVTRMNPIAEQLTGWTLQEAQGQMLSTIFPILNAVTREPIENPVEKVMASGDTVYLSNHTTLVSRSGKEYQIADSAAPICDNHKILGMVLVFNDVTEQYQLRQAAAKSKRDLQAILDHSPALIYVKDLEGGYTFINKTFEQLLNIKREDIRGKTDHDFFPLETADECRRSDKATLDAGHALKSEEAINHDDGLHVYISIKFPLLDNDENIYAICGISTDITDRQQTEEALRRSQKMEAIGQLSGGIAHDFNNQLGVIIGYLDFLDEYTSGDIEPQQWVGSATRATLRCMDLTRQLLAFSRKQSSEKVVLNLNATLRELQTMIARSLTPEVEVAYSLAEDLWQTEINAGEFQDALLNLVINARDAMPEGGQLQLETRNTVLDADYAALNPEVKTGDYLQLVLSDTGTGMDRACLERIFEPFFTTKPEGKGTGLGMAMVYGFVKRYGGHIKIYSELGVGSSVRLYLPRSSMMEATNTNNNEHNDALPRGHESVLIVDDEMELLQLADEYLRELGYCTYRAENAAQALDLLKQNAHIDLLFSDVVMPGGMNGYELAEQATQQWPDLKVLLASGFTSKTISHTGLAQFSKHLLGKPYRKAELASRIRVVLDETPAS